MSFFSFEDLLGGAFPGGGGGGHHHHHQDSEEEEEIDSTSYYKLIGVDKKASQDEIKKAYRKKARQLHPDKHPNEKDKYQQQFQELQKAFETLKDPHKRDLYDKYVMNDTIFLFIHFFSFRKFAILINIFYIYI